MTFKKRLKFYLDHGYWLEEAPREPDDLKDCYRNVEPHVDPEPHGEPSGD